MRDPHHPFAILLVTSPEATPLVVASAANADQATLTLHAELQRLTREHARGEVWVRRLNQDRPPLLRVTLSEPAASRTAGCDS